MHSVGAMILPTLLLLAAVLPGLARPPQRRQRKWAGKQRGTPATEDEASAPILDTAAALKARHTWSRNLSAELSALYDRRSSRALNGHHVSATARNFKVVPLAAQLGRSSGAAQILVGALAVWQRCLAKDNEFMAVQNPGQESHSARVSTSASTTRHCPGRICDTTCWGQSVPSAVRPPPSVFPSSPSTQLGVHSSLFGPARRSHASGDIRPRRRRETRVRAEPAAAAVRRHLDWLKRRVGVRGGCESHHPSTPPARHRPAELPALIAALPTPLTTARGVTGVPADELHRAHL